MKHSIRWQLTAVLAGMIVLMMAVTLVINQNFLDDAYSSYIQSRLISVYSSLNDYVSSNRSSDEASKIIEISESSNINVVIYSDNHITFSSSRDEKALSERIQDFISGEFPVLVPEDEFVPDGETDAADAFWETSVIIDASDHYTIYRSYDMTARGYYMECFGTLSENSYFLMRTPYQGMKDSVALSNRFYFITGIATMLVAIFLTYYLTGRLTKPIQELTGIVKRMNKLDFSVRYTGKDQNEIGILGESFNHMTEKLESTISELKTANVQLRTELKEREQLDAERNDFIVNISHDLKTPLSIIEGYAEGLKENICSSEEDRAFYCDVIMDETLKMSRLVNKLLMLNKIESGGFKPEIQHFDLTEMIQDLLSSYRVPMADRNITILFSEEKCYVWGDISMIEEAVSNYLSNAFHFVPDGGTIRISFCRRTDKDVRVSVYNSGSHLDEKDLDLIWDKFYMADKSRSSKNNSHGIGLSIVKAIMTLHGKEYGCYNEKDGIVFYLDLDCGES